ncbi:hypothetical protein TIFTF001_022609 [Ficus carica]|uniref:Uncharacterized protein n=1 Tax=Ficus carica TaxID=3494 RepID=A0AA88AM87_FICCA|nr:hypothetical protein TIFTF001_022609 [Ficus carica]
MVLDNHSPTATASGEIGAHGVGDGGEAGDVGIGSPSRDLATFDNWWLDN